MDENIRRFCNRLAKAIDDGQVEVEHNVGGQSGHCYDWFAIDFEGRRVRLIYRVSIMSLTMSIETHDIELGRLGDQLELALERFVERRREAARKLEAERARKARQRFAESLGR